MIVITVYLIIPFNILQVLTRPVADWRGVFHRPLGNISSRQSVRIIKVIKIYSRLIVGIQPIQLSGKVAFGGYERPKADTRGSEKGELFLGWYLHISVGSMFAGL
jgi:hypothetical protein